jgi:hypothetical protein
MVLLKTHHTARMLEVPCNKTDKNDARGLVQLVSSGGSDPCQERSEQNP